MTRPGLEPAPPASEANALTITLSGPWLKMVIYTNSTHGKLQQTTKWIDASFFYRQQRVVVKGVKSDWAPVASSVPLGTVLGPLLSSLHIHVMIIPRTEVYGNFIVRQLRYANMCMFVFCPEKSRSTLITTHGYTQVCLNRILRKGEIETTCSSSKACF